MTRTALLVAALAACVASPASAARYLHLDGTVTGDPATALHDVDAVFLAPLRAAAGGVLFNDTAQTDGTGRLRLNLIVEAKDAARAPAVDAYVAALQAHGFRGLTVVFQDVAEIDLDASLQLGDYNPNDEETAFTKKWEKAGHRSYGTLAAFLADYNGLGFGVIDKRHPAFEAFLSAFIGDPTTFADVRARVLPGVDMVQLVTLTTVRTADGAVAGPMIDSGPILPFTFSRACYSTRYEGGKCSGAPRIPAPEPLAARRVSLPSPAVRWD